MLNDYFTNMIKGKAEDAVKEYLPKLDKYLQSVPLAENELPPMFAVAIKGNEALISILILKKVNKQILLSRTVGKFTLRDLMSGNFKTFEQHQLKA